MSYITVLKMLYNVYHYYPIFMKTYSTIQYSIWLYSMILYLSDKMTYTEKFDETEWIVI